MQNKYNKKHIIYLRWLLIFSLSQYLANIKHHTTSFKAYNNIIAFIIIQINTKISLFYIKTIDKYKFNWSNKKEKHLILTDVGRIVYNEHEISYTDWKIGYWIINDY